MRAGMRVCVGAGFLRAQGRALSKQAALVIYKNCLGDQSGKKKSQLRAGKRRQGKLITKPYN